VELDEYSPRWSTYRRDIVVRIIRKTTAAKLLQNDRGDK